MLSLGPRKALIQRAPLPGLEQRLGKVGLAACQRGAEPEAGGQVQGERGSRVQGGRGETS